MKDSRLTDSEQGAVASFKAKARQFWGTWERLGEKKYIVEKAPPELKKEYKDLMERGVFLRKSISAITATIDSAVRGYETAVDYTSRGIETAINWGKDTFGLGALGVPILIPIAVIGVSIAAITKWLKDAYVVDQKLMLVEKLMKKGMSPKQALLSANKLIKKPSFFNVTAGVGLPLIAAAIIGFLYLKKGKK